MSAVLGNYGRFDFSPIKGEGSWVWDADGKKYLDFGTGIAVASLGHSPPCIQEVLKKQSAQLIHCSNLYQISQQEELAELINEKVMHRRGATFFCNSGAEANEALIKFAKRYGALHDPKNRSKIITFEGSFHGRTLGGISATAQSKIKDGFGELLAGFVHLPFNDIAAFQAELAKGEVLAVLLEPVQGEGGIHVASREFLESIGEACRAEEGPLLLVDEVQCGLGRTGDSLSWESLIGKNPSFEPDAVSWAKGMGGGFPLAATWFSDRVLASKTEDSIAANKVLGAGSHGTTYGGSPLASAVGLAVLSEIIDADLAENSTILGEKIVSEIESWQSAKISEVRGVGLMIGIVLEAQAFEGADKPSIHVVKELIERGLLTVPAGEDVIRILPPLNLHKDEAEQGLEILKQYFVS